MRNWLTRGAIALGVFIVGALVGWAGHGLASNDTDTGRILMYKDWRVACPSDKEQKLFCTMSSDLIDQKTGVRLAQVSLGREDGKPVLAVRVPLTVLISAGVGLQFGTETQTLQYATCAPDGCLAFTPVDDKLRNSFDAAKSFNLVVTAQSNKTVPIPISVQGFADAEKSLNNIEARRQSWWRRLWS
ncbi:MAG: invasion associated locus B family protein [Rhizomicrobium sp.]